MNVPRAQLEAFFKPVLKGKHMTEGKNTLGPHNSTQLRKSELPEFKKTFFQAINNTLFIIILIHNCKRLLSSKSKRSPSARRTDSLS